MLATEKDISTWEMSSYINGIDEKGYEGGYQNTKKFVDNPTLHLAGIKQEDKKVKYFECLERNISCHECDKRCEYMSFVMFK